MISGILNLDSRYTLESVLELSLKNVKKLKRNRGKNASFLTLRRAFRKVTPRRAGRHFWRLQENARQGFQN